MLVIITQIIKNINKKRKKSCIISQIDIIQDIYYLSKVFTIGKFFLLIGFFSKRIELIFPLAFSKFFIEFISFPLL